MNTIHQKKENYKLIVINTFVFIIKIINMFHIHGTVLIFIVMQVTIGIIIFILILFLSYFMFYFINFFDMNYDTQNVYTLG